MKRIKLFFAFIICTGYSITAQQKYEANWPSLDSRKIPEWFEDAKFGIFIHWGSYAVPSWAPAGDSIPTYSKYAEWYGSRLVDTGVTASLFQQHHKKIYGPNFRYTDFANQFKAELFNPGEWAERFKKSGAKYVVLTSKHHEGFTLWPSVYAWNWNAVDIGPHRDLLGDLTTAVRNAGLKMGYYYSLLEWFNPLYKKETIGRYVNEHMIPQMKELVTNYKPDIFWPDGEWEYNSDTLQSIPFLQWLYNESPVKNSIVVNDRWGKETRSKHGGYYTTEYDLIGEEQAGEKKIEHPWEECRGIGGSFGYNRIENYEDYSSTTELIKILIDKVARGGNLLLNIGPSADGRIPVVMQQRLTEMGDWLAVNGEGIYGTRKWEASPVVNTNSSVYYTRKGNDLFVITTSWRDEITVSGIEKPKQITMLGVKKTIASNFRNGLLTIKVPALTPATVPCRHAWVFKLEGALKK